LIKEVVFLTGTPRLEMKNISKQYYGNRVLKGVSFSLGRGEVLSLVGENGAGKSTLMNILFGMPVIHATGGFEGEIYLDGEKADIKSPEEAMKLGIGMVHQEFMLLPGFSITENIKLNREITKDSLLSRFFGKPLKWLDMPAMKDDARVSMDAIGLGIDEMLPVKGLPVGHMQFVEIARELDKKNIRLLVLDEPTAVLTESDSDKLLEAMKILTDKGISILFISHRLDEVMTASDKIVILRDGEQIAETLPSETSIERIAELMVGRKIESGEMKGRPPSELKDDYILQIRDLSVSMPGERVKGVNLDVKRGEILGIGGLAGQGKIGIANGIMGLFPSGGDVKKNGDPVMLNNTRGSLDNGMAFVSEDRRGTGLLLDDSIEFNIVATAIQVQCKFLTQGKISILDGKGMTEYASKMIRELDIRCTGPGQLTRRLSGGNQQKVCIARAITLEPNLLFVSEPTRGIDIGAKKLILDHLVKLNREEGLTIVMTSSELAELRSICDRIAIVYQGKLEGILLPTDSDRDFGLMMAGEYHKIHRKEAV
jgi:simple sugar transport system ATP-binding protein